jgi:hypothetical protein
LNHRTIEIPQQWRDRVDEYEKGPQRSFI